MDRAGVTSAARPRQTSTSKSFILASCGMVLKVRVMIVRELEWIRLDWLWGGGMEEKRGGGYYMKREYWP